MFVIVWRQLAGSGAADGFSADCNLGLTIVVKEFAVVTCNTAERLKMRERKTQD